MNKLHKKQQGFTLIEFIFATILASIIVTGITYQFIQHRNETESDFETYLTATLISNTVQNHPLNVYTADYRNVVDEANEAAEIDPQIALGFNTLTPEVVDDLILGVYKNQINRAKSVVTLDILSESVFQVNTSASNGEICKEMAQGISRENFTSFSQPQLVSITVEGVEVLVTDSDFLTSVKSECGKDHTDRVVDMSIKMCVENSSLGQYCA